MTPKRFLIINTYGIGDVLFTVPLIKNIAANVPDAFIGYIANRRTAPLLESVPQISKVTVYDRNEFKAVADSSKIEFLKFLRKIQKEIRESRYDIVFDLSLTWYAGFYCWLSGIKQRVGLNYKNRSPFLSKKVLFPGFEGRHVVEYYLSLLRAADFDVKPQTLEIPIEPIAREWAEHFLKEAHLSTNKLIAVFPGCGESWGQDAQFRRWPAAKHAQLISKMQENFNVDILLMGNKQEESLCKEVQSLVKCRLHNACGVTNLAQTMALLKASSLAVINDGGPLHMAVAAGTKTVSVLGPVDEKVYGPYSLEGNKHRVVTSDVVCRPCYRNFRHASCQHISCVKNVEVAEVFNAVKDLLK